MSFPRRRFLGSSLFVLGGALTEVLATPLWKWGDPALVQAAVSNTPPVQFTNVAQQAGLTIPNVWGGVDHKRSIRGQGKRPCVLRLRPRWMAGHLSHQRGPARFALARGQGADLSPLQKQSRRYVY